MRNIPLEDYQLTQREFYEKYHPEASAQLLPSLDEKAQAKLAKKNLSPSAGISLAFLVQQENLRPQVFFIATTDTRKRGLRFSLNGTADKNDASFHACRLREFSEKCTTPPLLKT